MLVDIHCHVSYESAYKIQDVLSDMEQFNIEKRVISAINGLSIRDNITAINDMVGEHSDRLIGCAVINPKQVTSVEDTEYALSLPSIKMFEFNPFEHAYYPDTVENLDEILALINEKHLPVKVFTGISCYGVPQQWEAYMKKFPNIKFIFLHMGCFDYGYTCIDVVARNENAYVEISNQYELQILRKCINDIEVDKILFGTTYPERLSSSAIKALDMLNLSEEVLDKIYHQNNQKVLGGVE